MTDHRAADRTEPAGGTTRTILGVSASLLLVNGLALIDLARRLGALQTSFRWQAAILGSLLGGAALLGIWIWSRGPGARVVGTLGARVRSIGTSLRWAGALVFVLLLPVLPLVTARLGVKAFEPLSMRIVLWWALALLGAVALLGVRNGDRFFLLVAFSGVALAVAHQLAGYLPAVSTYPLSLGWSETSRYYNASLFFAPRIYGQPVPLPVLHPSRYLMQSVPFLFGDLPLWTQRAWQVVLWIGVTFGTSVVLARKARLESRLARTVLIGVSYLFLMQGPVYYHLLPCALIVLAGASKARPWRTLLAVLLASAWAGISRVNWYPVPALVAITLYLLGQPIKSTRGRILSYLGWPIAYAVGGALTALAASRAYAAISGNPVGEFASSFTSDLLWYRLLPSATYPLGVLRAILLASVVPLLLIVLWSRNHPRALHPIRWAGLAGGLAVLFAGGLVVSAKIGGGGNLHNLDAYLVLLLILEVHLIFGSVATEEGEPSAVWRPSMAMLGAGVLIPVAFALASAPSWQALDFEAGRSTVTSITQAVRQASGDGQEVLFISERHLVAFEHLGVPLIPDYEKVYLMEMAMAGNAAYLEAFEADLSAHRFGLIVTEPLNTRLLGSEYTFGEENDVWARHVATPLLRFYRTGIDLGGVWLMVPR